MNDKILDWTVPDMMAHLQAALYNGHPVWVYCVDGKSSSNLLHQGCIYQVAIVLAMYSDFKGSHTEPAVVLNRPDMNVSLYPYAWDLRRFKLFIPDPNTLTQRYLALKSGMEVR